jgi:peptide/nickel transport system substrate-binding protein
MGRLLRLLCLAALLAPSAASAQDRAALLKQHSGGVMQLVANGAAGTLDVQIHYQVKGWQLFAFTYDGLVTFKKKPGLESGKVVADLAEALPQPQDGGKTYVFRLRPGIRFSNGQEVTTKDVVASFQRLFKVSSPNAGSWYAVIVGADACLKDPASCTLEGGVIGDEAAHTVTIRLTEPDSEFLYQLACPFASIVPASSPPRDMGSEPLPGTGPYMFKSYDPDRAAIMVRNPYFKEWDEDAQPAGFPDEIDYGFGLEPEAQVTSVLNGQADWMFEPVPLDRLGELGTKHAALVHIEKEATIEYISLNNRLAPFDNEKARLAVNYAVDRKAVANLYGGVKLATPLCQMLPAGVEGFEPYCPYTVDPGTEWKKPDLARAKQLMAESGMIGQKVTIISNDEAVDRSIGVYMQSLLNSLGFHATSKAISANIQFTYIQNTNNKVQAAVTNWEADYPAPSDFLHVLFSCANFHPGSDASINIAGYCDETTEKMMDDALATAVADPAAAAPKWAAIDKRVTDAAPIATLFQRSRIDLLSSRVGNYVWSDVYNMLFSQAWVQ